MCRPKQGIYYEARAVDVDVDRRQLTCVKQFCEVRGRTSRVRSAGARRYRHPWCRRRQRRKADFARD